MIERRSTHSVASLFVASLLLCIPNGCVVVHAQLIEVQGKLVEGMNVQSGNLSLSPESLQSMMDPARVLQAYLVDKKAARNERGGWGERASNVYQVGEQIDAVVQLANVGLHKPGRPESQQQMEVRIVIRNMAGEIKWETPVVHTFKTTPRLQSPLPRDYFRSYFTVSAKVPEPGRYKVGFAFQDMVRSADKRKEVEARVEVIVE